MEVLTIVIISFSLINILSSTILNKEYILAKLDETDYYKGIYQEIQSNFEKYIYQSGFDENIINEIITEDKVKNDVNIIISNIYDGTSKTIDTTEIKTNLNKKIDETIENKNLLITQKKSIETFVNTICDEYTETIVHTKYEQDINNMYVKVVKIVQLAKRALLVAAIVITLLICLICCKQIFKGIASLGISLTSSGLFLIAIIIFTKSKIKIDTIKILNDTISNSLHKIINSIVGNISSWGMWLLLVGIILIIFGNIINSKKNKEI